MQYDIHTVIISVTIFDHNVGHVAADKGFLKEEGVWTGSYTFCVKILTGWFDFTL